MKFGISVETARARERRALERLTGRQPLRRRAAWVERSVVIILLIACVLGILGGARAVRAVERASGRLDQRITAVTTAAAQLDARRQTVTGDWVADVSWTDRMGVAHRGHVTVPGDVPVGTQVDARLASNGVVRSAPDTAVDTWCLAIVVCVAIGLLVLTLVLIASELLQSVAQRIRLASWETAWAQWRPTAPNHEEL